MSDMYLDGGYKESNPTWHAEDAPWKARQVAGILEDNKIPFSMFAEVGCGTGDILVQMAERFPRVRYEGYDISPDALAIAETRERPDVSFHLADPLGDASKYFDVVLVADVIEHVEDCFNFLRGVKKLGTYKVFHIPLDLSAQSIIRMWPILNLRRGVGHIHYFAKDTALALLEDCGYKIENIATQRVGSSFPTRRSPAGWLPRLVASYTASTPTSRYVF